MIEAAQHHQHGRAARAGLCAWLLRLLALTAPLALAHCDAPTPTSTPASSTPVATPVASRGGTVATAAQAASFRQRFPGPQDDFEDRFLSADSFPAPPSRDAATPKRIVTTIERFPSR
ncbi:hypothetical protein RPB_2179 [Rhodopseudomonas palustris HaA2]|uniref:Lipoprotein n=1 Tax=Rhodopseudomonas palustris (strain HaA2) TaxID=316058 RepID=Q2IY25_RHOP2|nr:hypothetical protein [Rhodopseudomonas palustris]ABD06885.1 hypothetical protein RPB_2179 [Rhodopseudomonas palustris HaA2]